MCLLLHNLDLDPLSSLIVSESPSRINPNLLTFTEQFDNAAWVLIGAGASVAANNAADPLGGMTADTITTLAINEGIGQTSTVAATAGAAVSVNAAATGTVARYSVSGVFDGIDRTFSVWVVIVGAGNGTVQLRIERVGGFLRVAALDRDGGMQFALWGAKLEVGLSATGDQTNYGAHP